MKISHILSVEKLRDGGSLVISFQSDDSCEYWLMLPIVSSDEGEVVYGDPGLVNRTTGIEVDLDWGSAYAWLQRLSTHISNSEHQDLFIQMQGVVHGHT